MANVRKGLSTMTIEPVGLPRWSNNPNATERHIPNTAAEILRTTPSNRFRVADLAQQANVAMPTIYYYFSSINRVTAYAQALNYANLSAGVHRFDNDITKALEDEDPDRYWVAVEGHVEAVWDKGGGGDDLGLMRVIADIWTDEGARATFQMMMERRVNFWVSSLKKAQLLGWIHPSADVDTLVRILWGASIGQRALLTEDNEALIRSTLSQSVGSLLRLSLA